MVQGCLRRVAAGCLRLVEVVGAAGPGACPGWYCWGCPRRRLAGWCPGPGWGCCWQPLPPLGGCQCWEAAVWLQIRCLMGLHRTCMQAIHSMVALAWWFDASDDMPFIRHAREVVLLRALWLLLDILACDFFGQSVASRDGFSAWS